MVVNARLPIVMLWGPEGVMIYNDAYSVFAGGRHPRLLGSNVREGWPEVAEFNDNVMKVCLAGGTLAYKDQEQILHRNGRSEQVWMDLDYWPVPDESGAPAGVIATVVETTGRILTDHQKDTAGERLDMALSAGGGVGTWDWDVPADRVTADARFARLYGVDPDKARDGAPIAEFFVAMHPGDADRVQAEITQALATGQPFSSEYRLVQPDGDVRWVSAQGRASLSPQGEPLRFPGVTFDITDRRQMMQDLAEGETRYRTLFDSIDDGFCVIEMLFDEHDRPFDYRFAEINPAFGRQTSLTDAIGRTMRDFAPDMEQHWFDMYGRVATTGEPARFENRAEALSRWYDVYAFRVGEPEQRKVAVLFSDVTARKQIETRQAVLLDLSDAVRDLTDPAEIAQASARILAEAMNVTRAGYGVMDIDAETITIDRDYNAPSVSSIAGTLKFRDFGSYIEDLKRGETVAIADTATDPRTRDTADALAGIGVASFINMPLMEQGRVVALVFVNHVAPRGWTQADMDLMREVAEWVRAATERARADVALRESERQQAFLLTLADALRPLTNPETVIDISTRMIGQWLDADRVGYAQDEPEEGMISVRRDYVRDRPSLQGRYRYEDYGTDLLGRFRLGETVVRPDIAQDTELSDVEKAAHKALGLGATINVPLLMDGRLQAVMFAHWNAAHAIPPSLVRLIEGASERVRSAFDRVNAEADRRASESRYRTLFDTMDDGFCVIEFIDGPHGPMSDYVHVEANPATARQVGMTDVVGRAMRDMTGDNAQPWIDLHGEVLRTGKSARFEREFKDTGRWLEVTSYRVEPASRRQVAVLFKDLTARRKAEMAVRESEARFRNMADNTPMMMWVTDPTGYCTYLNRTWYEFTGQSEGEAEGFGWLDATHPDDKARAEKAFIEANAAQGPFRIEYRLRRADGVYRWAIDAASPRFDAEGNYLGYVGSVIDIDDRREIEDALRASEADLRALNADLERRITQRAMARGRTWQLSSDLLSVINLEGYFEEHNPAWHAVLGWSAEEVATTPFMDFVHPDDVARTEATWADAVDRGLPALHFENRYRTRDGDWRWLSWVAVPDEGKVYCSARDITDQKAQVAERDRLWELSPDLLTVVSYNGRLERINPSWTRVLGHDEETLLTRPYVEILHPDEIASIADLLETMKATEQPVMLEDRLLTSDGNWRSFVWTLSPEPGGERLYGIGRDVTDERAQTQELAKAHEALRQSQKMEAVGQLTGGIAHDFNNLLAGISGSLELLQKRMAEGRTAGVDRYVTAAQESSRRAASLTQRLLAFSRRQTLDPKATDLNRLIGGMEDLIRRTVGPDVEVEVVGAGGLWATRIDPSQLENALLNLCINARDAMAPKGGRLTVETANKWLDERAARDRDLAPGQYVSLCVTDTGSGMTPEVMEKAFDPFFTTKPIGQGTGLGLSMIHGFVRQSGGQVRIYSEIGKGTTMCLYLPRFQGEIDGDDVFEQAIDDAVGHGETVLVIDDEPTVRMLIVEVLQDTGYTVLEAEDGPSGLRILHSDVRIDLLVTDVGLPGGMNGRQVADAARVGRPDLKILFVTGYAENAAVGNGLLDAGMAVITKPFEVAGLGNKVREMIEG